MKPKSRKPAGSRARRSDAPSPGRGDGQGRAVVIDFVQSRIEAFNDEQGGGVAVRKDAAWLHPHPDRYGFTRGKTPAARERGPVRGPLLERLPRALAPRRSLRGHGPLPRRCPGVHRQGSDGLLLALMRPEPRDDEFTANRSDVGEDRVDVPTAVKPRGVLGLPRNVWAVTLTSFLTDISSEMLVWLLPLYLSGVLGAPTAAIGLIEGAAETTASVLKVFSGWLSDALGRRKWLAVSGYALSTLARPFLLVVSSWPGRPGGPYRGSGGQGNPHGPTRRPGRRQRRSRQPRARVRDASRGRYGGRLVGVLIALQVSWLGQGQSTALSPAVFRALVVCSVLPAVLAVLALAALARETPVAACHRDLPTLRLALLDRRFRVFLAIMVLFTLGNSSDAFLVLRAQRCGTFGPGIARHGTLVQPGL